jgi:selenide,water dikinase
MAQLDLAKRRRIMQRSMKLGHCICDPRRPCPCDVFKNDGICPCAGEKPKPVAGEVKLLKMVHNAGCASKIAAGDLEAVLQRLPAVNDPAVLSGMPAGDDAGIYKLTDDLCLVQTVDVMTPCVDDAYTFGRICAANCLSDVYAMGGVPRTAMSVLAFPSETLDTEIVYQMTRGAMDVFAQADVALLGGHSIKDDEIKLGFAITGTVAAAAAVRHETARPGDVIVLTKPLGTGVLGFCRQIGRPGGDEKAQAESMATLNRAAAEAMNEVGASACTDVTGFGLFGHLISLCRHSGVTAQIFADRLPAFDGAVEALADEVIPGAIERNSEYVGDDLSAAGGVPQAAVLLGFDAQTSGGLMICVPAERHQKLLAALEARGTMAATIGRITGKSDGKIVVTLASQDASAAPTKEIVDTMGNEDKKSAAEPASACCKPAAGPCCGNSTSPTPADAGNTAAARSQEAFAAMLKASAAGGAIDAKTKELMTYALVILSRCGPCLKVHHEKALKMGLTSDQLAEALWLAVFIGGAPVKMFYDETLAAAPAPAPQAQKHKGGCCG